MNDCFKKIVLEATKACDLEEIEIIQSLWSGYGKIARYRLSGSEQQTVVVKLVQLPNEAKHPRGWNTNLSHERKVKSYQVETNWYSNFAHLCDKSCRVPHCFALESRENEVLIVLEDLDAAGFPKRKNTVNKRDIESCLSWLANFHATFMERATDGLWKQGTYWHLDTRPEELEVLDDEPLKAAAVAIDRELENTPFKTIVHGDAKLANFCFSQNSAEVAAVDFQYVGGGCGMKDLAYFIGSCLRDDDCQAMEQILLDHYFHELRIALKHREKKIDFDSLEIDWRRLYPYAWTDFHRFLKGWSPGHWKINSYSERLANQVIAELEQ